MQALSEIHAFYFIRNALYFNLNTNFKNQKKVKFTEKIIMKTVLSKATS